MVFRGSTTFEDWRRDFDVWADPFGHSKIGPVHPGFLLGVDQVLDEYRQKASGAPLVGGHSLGAGRAGWSKAASSAPKMPRSIPNATSSPPLWEREGNWPSIAPNRL